MVLRLVDDVDVGRGDLLVCADDPPMPSRAFEATVCWLGEEPLASRRYALKHTTRTTRALIEATDVLDVGTGSLEPAGRARAQRHRADPGPHRRSAGHGRLRGEPPHRSLPPPRRGERGDGRGGHGRTPAVEPGAMTRHGPGYPITLDVTGRLAVVVGGGTVATRRARALADAGGARARRRPTGQHRTGGARAAGLGLVLHRRPYAPGDLAGAWLAHAATDDRRRQRRGRRRGRRRCGSGACARTTPGRRRHARRPSPAPGDVTVAVTSGDPARSRELAGPSPSPPTPARCRCGGAAGARSVSCRSSAAAPGTPGSSPSAAAGHWPRRTS